MKKYELITKHNTCGQSFFVRDLKFNQIIGLIRYCHDESTGITCYRIASYSPLYDFKKLTFTTAIKAANFLHKRLVK